MIVLGEVGDEGHSHTHVDACSDCDGEHSQEQGPPRAGAGLVEIPLGHGFIGLMGQVEGCNAQRPEAAEHGEDAEAQVVLWGHHEKVVLTLCITGVVAI